MISHGLKAITILLGYYGRNHANNLSERTNEVGQERAIWPTLSVIRAQDSFEGRPSIAGGEVNGISTISPINC